MLNFGQSAIFSLGLTGMMLLASKGIMAGELGVLGGGCVSVWVCVCVCVWVRWGDFPIFEKSCSQDL